MIVRNPGKSGNEMEGEAQLSGLWLKLGVRAVGGNITGCFLRDGVLNEPRNGKWRREVQTF